MSDKAERNYIEMESQCNDKSEDYFAARAMMLDTTHNRGLFKAGFERAWQHQQPIIDAKDEQIQTLTKERDDLLKRFEGCVAVPVDVYDSIAYCITHKEFITQSLLDKFLTANEEK